MGNKIILVVYVINSTEVVLLLAQRWKNLSYKEIYLFMVLHVNTIHTSTRVSRGQSEDEVL